MDSNILSKLKDYEIVGILCQLNKKKSYSIHTALLVHPLNMKRPQEGQFQVNFLTLRAYLEEFFKYNCMRIKTFDEVISEFKLNYTTTKYMYVEKTFFLRFGLSKCLLHFDLVVYIFL